MFPFVCYIALALSSALLCFALILGGLQYTYNYILYFNLFLNCHQLTLVLQYSVIVQRDLKCDKKSNKNEYSE